MKTYNQKQKSMLCIPAELSQLEKLRIFVRNNAQKFGFNDEDSLQISLAIDEACTNLIQYAFKKEPSNEICVEIELLDNKLIINILDEGAPFNPLDYESPEMNEYFKKFKRGGLGIHLIKLIMDEIVYIPSSSNGSKNILKLGKSLS